MSTRLPQVGARVMEDGRTRFTVWAPRHERLSVAFPDTGRAEDMTAGREGYHTLVTEAPAGTRYQYQFADGRLRPDPASLAQPEGVHGASVVVETRRGKGAAYLNPPLKHHVLYELHVGTFTPEGTFDAVIPRIAALRELGVTAIELMPIGQFPGERNWGYDGVCACAAQWSYGGVAGLRRLVEWCHERGMGVILDVVYNHVGPEGNYLGEFGGYFTERYRTPWGPAMNFDGRDSDHVREYFIQSSLFWTGECGVDGLRLDAVHAIVDQSARTFIEELTERNHAEAARQGRRVLIIAESGDNDPRLVRARSVGGCGMDGCWNDDYHHAVRAALTGERRGYYRAFGEPGQIARALRERFVFTGEYSSGYGRRHGAPARDVARGCYVVFTQNHDQVGNRATGDRLDRSAGMDGARVAAALVVLSPFTPLLWMGEEYGEAAPFQYFVSHGDGALIEAVRRGRAAEFAEFQGTGDVPDPQAEGTFLASKLAWEERGTGEHAKVLAYYAELLRLRRELDVAGRSDEVEATTEGTVVVVWYGGGAPVVVMANVGSEAGSVRVERLDGWRGGAMELVLDSGEARWGGAGAGVGGVGGGEAGRDGEGTREGEIRVEGKTVLVWRAGEEGA